MEAEHSSGRPSGRARRRLGALALGGALALVGAELLLRLLWTRTPDVIGESFRSTGAFVEDPELGWLARPDLELRCELSTGHAWLMRTNSRGFRDVEHAHGPGERPRVVVLGDSFAEGYGVENEEAFCARLQELLPQAEVVNLGVTAYDLAREHALLRREGLAYEPAVVLLALYSNDISPEDEAGAAGDDEPAPAPSLKRFLASRLRLYLFASELAGRSKGLSRALVRLGVKDELAGYERLADCLRPFLREPPAEFERDWRAAVAELAALRRTCAEAGATLVVAAVPTRETIRPEELPRALLHVDYEPADFDLDQGYERLAAECAALELAFVDPRPAFRASREPLYLDEDIHFTPAGHALFARLLAPAVGAALADAGR